VPVHLSECAGPTHGYGASCGRPWHPDDSSHWNDNPRPFTWHKSAEEIPAGSPATAAPSTNSERANLTGH
jgi:hypothetical protein